MTDFNVRAWMEATRTRINTSLETYFDEKKNEARAVSPQSIELVEEAAALTLRGGKRFRPLVAEAAYFAVSESPNPDAIVPVGGALELLQSYLLIHDDWMDGDEERRDGPAAHMAYRQRGHEGHIADSLAILAGDIASAYSWELFLRAPYPAERRAEACERFLTIQKEVYFGQHLDVTANPDVSRMHDLKTGSYTVRGPLMLGALLGDPSPTQIEQLLAFGNPIGEAFQLADDLLGTFADAGQTGKPGDDLFHKKRTCLIGAAEKKLSAEKRVPIDELMSFDGTPPEALVAEVAELLITSGVRNDIESRLHTLLEQATSALTGGSILEPGRDRLKAVAQKLAIRSK